MISIIIPTRRPEALGACIASIDAYTSDYEVTVVAEGNGLNAKINNGMKQAKGDFIILLHDDCEVTPDWAKRLTSCGSFCVGEHGGQFDHWGGFFTGGYCQNSTQHPDYPAFFCFSKEVAQAVMPLDENYIEPGYQDTDLGKVLQSKGYRLDCLPGRVIHHHYRTAPLANEAYYKEKWKC